MKLFSDRSATDNFASFEHKCLEPCLSKVTGGDKSVVTCTDYDCVIDHVLYLCLELCALYLVFRAFKLNSKHQIQRTKLKKNYFKSLIICNAALRPGAPIIPPPGCVADPHM